GGGGMARDEGCKRDQEEDRRLSARITGRRHHGRMEYPDLAARTRRFTYGAPRSVTVGSDGARVVFLRSRGPEDPTDALFVFDVATGAERLMVDPIEVLRARAAAGDEVEPTAAE